MREKPPATGICADDDFDRNYSVLIFMQDAFEWQCTEEEKKNVYEKEIKLQKKIRFGTNQFSFVVFLNVERNQANAVVVPSRGRFSFLSNCAK